MNRVSSLLTCTLLVTFTGWAQVSFWHHTNGPGTGQDVRSLASNSQGVLFAGTWTAGEVFQTTDNGDTWTKCGAIPNTNPILGLSVDRHDHLFASVYLRGVARSTDNGATWQMKNTGLTNFAVRGSLVDKYNRVWVATEGGLFRSTDDGESWTNMRPGGFFDVWLDSTNAIVSETVDNYGNGTIHRSSESGTSQWSTTPVAAVGLGGIAADGSYYAYTSLSQIFRSTDFGATWTDMHSPVSWDGYTAHMIFTPQGDVFYARDGNAAGLLRSTDNGTTWQVKNDGLTTTRVIPLFYHPNGYLFLGTNGAGVFRSTDTFLPPEEITASLPQALTAAGNTLEIPVNVTRVSGWGICAFEFTLTFNAPDSILAFDAAPVTAGTLCSANGWSVLVNAVEPNRVTVGAYGALPLSGEGPLLKLVAHTFSGAKPGDSCGLVLSHFLFNSGGPAVTVLAGSVTVHERVCGDADENGSVQAYDAALTLREAIGPMAPPPAPLTAMGRLNADVDRNGKVQVYDAALILRHAIGLPMPESTATCFETGNLMKMLPSLGLKGQINSTQYAGGRWVVQTRLVNLPANFPVISCSFDLTTPANAADNVSLTLPPMEQGCLATVNTLGDGRFRVGIVNPNGIDVENIPFTLTASYSSSLNAITFSELFLNDAPNDTIRLTNIFTSVETPEVAAPQSYDLIGAYPNPFNPSTRIVFQTPASAHVRLEVYNMQGIKIKTLRDEQMASGRHEVIWDGTNSLGQRVSTGEFFCLMRADSFVKTLRLLLLK